MTELQQQEPPKQISEMLYWRAVYTEDTIIGQKYPDDKSVKYADIDRTKLRYFDLLLNNRLWYRLRFTSSRQKLFWRRRTFKQMNSSRYLVVHMLGWVWQEHGRNIKTITVIFPDGHIETSNEFEDQAIFDTVTPHPHEGEDFDGDDFRTQEVSDHARIHKYRDGAEPA